jgi:hypothetical protein
MSLHILRYYSFIRSASQHHYGYNFLSAHLFALAYFLSGIAHFLS